MSAFDIRPTTGADRAWIVDWIKERWGDVFVVSRGEIHHPEQLPGFAALQDGRPVGLLTYRIDGDQCEIVTIDSQVKRQGIGAALIDAALDVARRNGLRRVWLITTNDNTPAQHFYERCGFRVAAVHRGAIDESRRLKPAIPLVGLDGVEIHDEIEFEIALRD